MIVSATLITIAFGGKWLFRAYLAGCVVMAVWLIFFLCISSCETGMEVLAYIIWPIALAVAGIAFITIYWLCALLRLLPKHRR